MINHVRSLLFNMQAASVEYVPPGFRPVLLLPPAVRAVRPVLFGADARPEAVDGRLHQFMRILHATELEEFVYAADPRVTYLPFGAGGPPAPPGDPAAVLAGLASVGTALLDLMGREQVEPWATWRNLWQSHKPLPYRLGAVLLAVAARTDLARSNR